MGLLGGLTDGLLIAFYDVGLGDRDAFAGVGLLLAVLTVALVHVGVWALIGAAFRRLQPSTALRLGLSFWLLAAFLAKGLRPPTVVAALPWIYGTLLAVLWLVPGRLWRRLNARAARGLVGFAVVLVVALNLYGRVPGYRYALPQVVAFDAVGAALAVLLVFALCRAPRRLAAGVLLAVALSAVAPSAVIPAFRPSPPDEAPNVLWILVDTTRRDHLSPFGATLKTPAIEALAASGVLFEDAVTVTPKTPSSVASFFSGLYPVHHGVRRLYDGLPSSQLTAAEVFREAGYRTLAFVNNPWMAAGQGFEQGFERFRSPFEIDRPFGVLRYTSWVTAADRLGGQRIPGFNPQSNSKLLTDTVIEALRGAGRTKQPFFVYAHYFEPHWPYYPPPDLARAHGAPEDGGTKVNTVRDDARAAMIFNNAFAEEENEAGRRLYRAEVEHTAAQVGRLLGALGDLGLDERTIVVFTADHGHSLGQHGYYFHHGSFLYDDSIRIPLVLRWPGQIPAGRRVSAQVRSIDLVPTLYELTGIEAPPDLDGRSLSGFWNGTSSEEGRWAFLESDVKMYPVNRRRPIGDVAGKLRAIRDGRHKLILTPHPDGAIFEVYDLLADPGETRNLIGDPAYRDLAHEFLDRLRRMIPAAERDWRGREASGDAEQLNAIDYEVLRSLGYV